MMRKILLILFLAYSFTAKSQIYFTDICGFKYDTCGVSWGISGDYLLKGQLPPKFETVWFYYTCTVLKEPKYVDGKLIEVGEIELKKK